MSIEVLELEITVVQADGLRAMDRSFFGRPSSSDPFVEVRLCPKGNAKAGDVQEIKKFLLGKTTAKPKTLSPTWNETFKASLPVKEFDDFAFFELTILDKDGFYATDLMGVVPVYIPIGGTGSTTSTKWHGVPRSSGEKKKAKGRILCSLTVRKKMAASDEVFDIQEARGPENTGKSSYFGRSKARKPSGIPGNVEQMLEVEITVRKAKGLAARNKNVLGMMAHSDPYIKVSMCPQGPEKGEKFLLGKTPPKMKTLDPIWRNQTFSFTLPKNQFSESAMFELTIMDFEDSNEDDLMGVVPVPIPIRNPGTTTKWYDVPSDSAGGAEATGKVECSLRVTYGEKQLEGGPPGPGAEHSTISVKSADRSDLEAPSTDEESLELGITVTRASGLAAKDKNLLGMKAKSDPYIKVTLCPLGPKKAAKLFLGKTPPKMKTLDPTWKNQNFAITLPKRQVNNSAIFELTIMDFDEKNKDDLMGVVPVPIPIGRPGTTTRWYDVPPNSALGEEATGRVECIIRVANKAKESAAKSESGAKSSSFFRRSVVRDSNAVSSTHLENTIKEKILEVGITVIKARGLAARDKNILGMKAKSDPYIKVALCPHGSEHDEKQYLGKTPPKMKTLDPTWKNQTFSITLPKDQISEKAMFELTIMDFDDSSEDDLMGVITVPIPIEKSGTKTKWYEVPPDSAGGQKATGKVKCALRIIVTEQEVEAPSESEVKLKRVLGAVKLRSSGNEAPIELPTDPNEISGEAANVPQGLPHGEVIAAVETKPTDGPTSCAPTKAENTSDEACDDVVGTLPSNETNPQPLATVTSEGSDVASRIADKCSDDEPNEPSRTRDRNYSDNGGRETKSSHQRVRFRNGREPRSRSCHGRLSTVRGSIIEPGSSRSSRALAGKRSTDDEDDKRDPTASNRKIAQSRIRRSIKIAKGEDVAASKSRPTTTRDRKRSSLRPVDAKGKGPAKRSSYKSRTLERSSSCSESSDASKSSGLSQEGNVGFETDISLEEEDQEGVSPASVPQQQSPHQEVLLQRQKVCDLYSKWTDLSVAVKRSSSQPMEPDHLWKFSYYEEKEVGMDTGDRSEEDSPSEGGESPGDVEQQPTPQSPEDVILQRKKVCDLFYKWHDLKQQHSSQDQLLKAKLTLFPDR